MTSKGASESHVVSTAHTEEFKVQVMRRGLELRNWSAACREFHISMKTLRFWRKEYSDILERLAYEMGVEVYYNPRLELECKAGKSGSNLMVQPNRDTRVNLILSTRILTHLESAALVLKKAKVPMTTQRIYQDILLFQLRNRIDFDALKNDLLSNCGADDPFSLMKSTTAFFNENIYAFRLKQNPSTKKLLNSGYSSLKEDVKLSFLPSYSAIKNAPSEQLEETDSSLHNSKGINLLVPNLCVKPISVANSDGTVSPGPVSMNCHQIYIRENSFPIVSPSLCKETAPSPVKYLLASDRRRGKEKHRGVSGEEFPPAVNHLMGEELEIDVDESMVTEVPVSATSSVIIERQSESLSLNTPCVLLPQTVETGQLYHVVTHPDQLIHTETSLPSSCTERAEVANITTDLGLNKLGIAVKETNTIHMVSDIQTIKRENQKKPVTRSRRKKNGITSPVTHFLMEKDIKTLINKNNFIIYFSKEEREELISLLPEVDQIVTPSEAKLSETAFCHEYFSQALTEWHEDILCGEVSLNAKTKSEKNEFKKSDLWKVKQLHDYESQVAKKSSNALLSGVVSVDDLQIQVEHEKRSLSKSFDDSSLCNLFLHPSMLHSCVTQLSLGSNKTIQTEVRLQLNKFLIPVLPMKKTGPSDVIDLTLSDSDDSILHTDEILFNRSSLVINLPRLPADFDRETPTKKAHSESKTSSYSGVRSSMEQPSNNKKFKRAHKERPYP